MKKWLATPYILWAIVFTLVPLGMILIYGVTSSVDGKMVFSMENIIKVFDPIYFKAMVRSINYAAISTVICLVLAYPLALILSEKRCKSAIIFIFVLPMWMNFLLRTYAWLTILETNNGFLNTLLRFVNLPTLNIIGKPSAVILGMVYNFLPFMILPIYNVLSKIDPFVLEAAYDLGANQWTRFKRSLSP